MSDVIGKATGEKFKLANLTLDVLVLEFKFANLTVGCARMNPVQVCEPLLAVQNAES